MPRKLPVLVAGLIILSFGLAHGFWTDRWTVSRALEDAKTKLELIPTRLGEWDSHPVDIDPQEWSRLNLTHYLVRRYIHRGTGADVTIYLACGRPGPVAVHTPDICYEGAGYRMVESPGRQTVRHESLPASEFWSAQFRREEPNERGHECILWSWCATGAWQAPENPRLVFAKYPVLYKLYVIRRITGANDLLDEDPAIDFLQTFLPELGNCLFSAA